MAVDPDWNDGEEMLRREEQTLWKCEHEVRLRSDGLTPLECKELRKSSMWNGNARCLSDAEKLQNFFGLASGGNAACKRLLKWCYEQKPSQPGQSVHFRDVQFTLGKHLLLAERRQDLKNELPQHLMPCKCFAATYVMPGGCIHTKQLLWKAPTARSTFCPTCSTCLRCHKLPVFYH